MFCDYSALKLNYIMACPIPTPIFHITPIDNLTSIAKRGELVAKNAIIKSGIIHADISYATVQGRRAARTVDVPPGGTLHDYVPFYFAPRSPMLYTINNGNVPNCSYRQRDIVYLVSTAQIIADTRIPFVFSNIHAALRLAKFFGDLTQLNQIDWSIFFEFR